MSSLTVTIPSFNMTSSWTGSGAASTAKATKYPDISSILAGSTINSAKLSCDANIGMWYGSFSINGKTFYGNSVEDHDVKNCITGGADGFTMAIPFTYKTAKQGYTDDGAYHASALQLSNISIVIDYTLPYTACTAPTSLTVAKANAAPGETVRVSWSGAQGGTNNAISSYTVYRSSDGNTWTALQSGITNAYLDVTAPSTNGATYHYAVMTVGSVAGYNSARSTVTASVKQQQAVQIILKHGHFQRLPKALKEAAELRLNYPDASLQELADMADIKKAGMNHRLTRLVEYAQDLESGLI